MHIINLLDRWFCSVIKCSRCTCVQMPLEPRHKANVHSKSAHLIEGAHFFKCNDNDFQKKGS